MQFIYRFLIIGILIPQISWGQNRVVGKSYNFMNKENKAYYFGITLGTHQSNYKIFRSKDFYQQNLFNKVESVTGPGYNVNVIANLKIGRYIDFRLLPGFTFAERNIVFGNERNDIESVFAEIPLHFRYKSEPYSDMRVFAFAGFKYGFDIASESRQREQNNIVELAPSDFSIEAGFGCQFFFPYFILSPEIKFTHGLTNTLIFNDQSPQSNLIEKILSRALTISFHFEG